MGPSCIRCKRTQVNSPALLSEKSIVVYAMMSDAELATSEVMMRIHNATLNTVPTTTIRTKLRHHVLATWLLCLQQIHMRANQMPANLRFASYLRYRFIINLYTPYNYSAKYFWFHKDLASDIYIINIQCFLMGLT